MKLLKKTHANYLRFWLLILNSNISIIVASVLTWLQTCAKVLQMHLSGGGGTPWMQPKSNVTCNQNSLELFKILVADFVFKYFY